MNRGARVRLPVRIDLLGSWSDQLAWDEPAAVVNVAVGWDGQYPLTLDERGKLYSVVSGIGTGLGISSILAAGRFLQQRPDGDYVGAVLAWEQQQGTQGGWQDQIGGIDPGCKLIETPDHRTFTVARRDDHPLLRHLVLFDTGTRRESKRLGDRVRKYLGSPKSGFCQALRRNVAEARAMFRTNDAEAAAEACISGWARLCEWVPEMSIAVPYLGETWGHKLVGAGGGGFGIYFARSPELRPAVITALAARGLWARVPEVLPGIEIGAGVQ